MIDEQIQSGPCVVCGKTNYPLSFGGQTICPTCDLGTYDANVIAANNAKMTARLDKYKACEKQLMALLAILNEGEKK